MTVSGSNLSQQKQRRKSLESTSKEQELLINSQGSSLDFMKKQISLQMPLSKTFLISRFIKKCLGAPSDTDVEQLKSENEELKAKNAHLEKQIQDLHHELEQERANH
jgi:multidrug resistance efflux pump